MISIIVPIYNSEDTLDKCLDSIENQSYQNLEIILINDGSSDHSEEICLKHQEKDDRIVYVKQENGGVSSARNHGLKIAKGELVQFVDSDDTIDPYTCEKLIASLVQHDSDLAVCGYHEVKDGVSTLSFVSKREFCMMEDVLQDPRILTYEICYCPWNKLYKKEYINHFFLEGVSLGEDLLFLFEYLNHGNMRISFVQEELCEYKILEGSLIHSDKPFEQSLQQEKTLYEKASIILSSYEEVGLLQTMMDTYFMVYIINSLFLLYKQEKHPLETVKQLRDDACVIQAIRHVEPSLFKESSRRKWMIIYRLFKNKQYKILHAVLKMNQKRKASA